MEIAKLTKEKYFDTKKTTWLFLLRKTGEGQNNAKKIIMNVSESMAFDAVAPLIEALEKDNGCLEIALVAYGLAGELFKKYFNEKQNRSEFVFFEEIKDGKNYQDEKDTPFWISALRKRGVNNFDIVLATVDSLTDSNSVFFLAKKFFSAGKVFLLHYSWTSITARADLFRGDKNQINAVFCNDELAKKIIVKNLPDFPKNKILTTGTPIIDSVREDENNKKSIRIAGRKKMVIEDDEFAFLYLGDIDSDYIFDKTIDKHINKKTFQETILAMRLLPFNQPNKKFVLLIRSHPRDEHREDLTLDDGVKIPNNLRIIYADDKIVSIEEAVYGSDVIGSIISTENHLASLRGKTGIFLAYQKKEKPFLGEKVLKNVYGANAKKFLEKEKDIFVVSSGKELAQLLERINLRKEKKFTKRGLRTNSTKKILNIMFK